MPSQFKDIDHPLDPTAGFGIFQKLNSIRRWVAGKVEGPGWKEAASCRRSETQSPLAKSQLEWQSPAKQNGIGQNDSDRRKAHPLRNRQRALGSPIHVGVELGLRPAFQSD